MKLITALLSLALVGCAGMPTIDQERQGVSSGFIGCAPDDIEIRNGAQYTWTAICKGTTFMCTAAPNAACTKAL